MTEEEFSNLFNDQELDLLDQLGNSLRAEPPLELPPDFAKQTAQGIEARFEKLSSLTKLAVRMETVLEAPMTSRRALPWGLGLMAGTAGTGWLGGAVALTIIAIIMLLSVVLWKAGWMGTSPGTPAVKGDWRAQLFYLMPVASALSIAILCGGALAALGSNWELGMLGPAIGLTVFAFVVAALQPTWKALQRQSIGRPRWIAGVQLFHTALPLVLASLAWNASNQQASVVWIWLLLLVPAGALTLMLGSRPTAEAEGRPAVWRALGTSMRSLLVGSLPIGAVLAIAYQASLTRQVDYPQRVEKIRRDVGAWVVEQQAIPAELNGWLDIKEAFSRERSPYLQSELEQGGVLYNDSKSSSPDPKQHLEARSQFLDGLRSVEAALQKPHFSHIATEGLTYGGYGPNTETIASVNRGLAGLARESCAAGQAEQSLHYQEVGLHWSTCFRKGWIYLLWRSLGQADMATENVERWVFETKPSREQLQRMLLSLQQAEPAPGEWAEALSRTIYGQDKAFLDLLSGKNKEMIDGKWSDFKWWERMAPLSYWSSRHKSFLNEVTAELEGLKDLKGVKGGGPLTFLLALERFEALKTVVALELFKTDNGHYPEELKELVPTYLPELPREALSPKSWETKPTLNYTRKGEVYEIVSESPIYRILSRKTRQLYGPDGNYDLETP